MEGEYPNLGYGECDVIIEHSWGDPAIKLYEKARCVKTKQVETTKDLFSNLVSQRRPEVHRGFHKSGCNQKYLVSVFYNDCGWVDIGYAYAKRLQKRFKFSIDLVAERYENVWQKESKKWK